MSGVPAFASCSVRASFRECSRLATRVRIGSGFRRTGIASLRPEWTSSGVPCSRAWGSSLSPSCHIDARCNPLHADLPEGFRQRDVLVLVVGNILPWCDFAHHRSKLRKCGRGRGSRCREHWSAWESNRLSRPAGDPRPPTSIASPQPHPPSRHHPAGAGHYLRRPTGVLGRLSTHSMKLR